jgi:hypothetical protein
MHAPANSARAMVLSGHRKRHERAVFSCPKAQKSGLALETAAYKAHAVSAGRPYRNGWSAKRSAYKKHSCLEGRLRTRLRSGQLLPFYAIGMFLKGFLPAVSKISHTVTALADAVKACGRLSLKLYEGGSRSAPNFSNRRPIHFNAIANSGFEKEAVFIAALRYLRNRFAPLRRSRESVSGATRPAKKAARKRMHFRSP